MAVRFDDAEQNLAALVTWWSSTDLQLKRNEATTRLNLIDTLLFDCLGWDRNDCQAEESYEGTYTDYSLGLPSRQLVIEAKREGTHFQLPAGEHRRIIPISYFAKYTVEIYAAIQQAMRYAQSRGIPFACVCNGHQLIAFIASRNDGTPPDQGRTLVFDSLDTMRGDFLLLWQSLSKEGFSKGTLWTQLEPRPLNPPPDKLSAYIPGYPGYKRRNALQTDLQILAELFIEDIAQLGSLGDEREFLDKCYATNGALSQYAIVSREILRTRYASLFGSPSLESATTKKGINPDLLAHALSRRPILLIGDRGVGKSTFIKHLSMVESQDIFDNAIVLNLDFGAKPTFLADLQTFVYDEISDQLYNKYSIDLTANEFVRGVLNGELQRFERSFYGSLKQSSPDTYVQKRMEIIEEHTKNRDEYLKRSFDHISKGRRQQIVLFLDNVDQRTDDFQEQVFLIGQTIAANWPLTVFVSLRPETFRRSRLSGTLSAYQARAFTIAPPRVDEVIVKRLQYGIELLEKGLQIGLDHNISVHAETLKQYLKVLVHSFSKNRHLIEFLDNMCGGNIRLALEFVRTFISSGHVDTEKILRIERESGSYLVPLHEFVRAVTYGDHEHYFPEASEIVNLFDISSPDPKEHFLSLLALAFLDRHSQMAGEFGFVDDSELVGWCQSLGYVPRQINYSLDRLRQRKLVETATREHIGGSAVQQRHRITSVGGYYVKRLVTRFTYLDAIVVDTPIIDGGVRRSIQDVWVIADRLDRAKALLQYLDKSWATIPVQGGPLDWGRIKYLLNRDIEYVQGLLTIREDLPEADSGTVNIATVSPH